jgi:Helix-turn-helix domain
VGAGNDRSRVGATVIDHSEMLERLDRIEQAILRLTGKPQEKEWYTPAEAAGVLGRAAYTIREWARHRRIKASKRRCGRGNAKEWMISGDELRRIKNEGLLPLAED